MKANIALPLPTATETSSAWRNRGRVALLLDRNALPRVERIERKSAALHDGPLAEAAVLNLAMGCAHRCAFCPARAFPSYPGDGVVHLYTDTAERLAEELATRRKRPRAVYISPATDPFPPLLEVQQETAKAVKVLGRRGVQAWLMTRGFIRPKALRVLAEHRRWVRVTFGLTSLDRKLSRILEPWSAPPRLRLRQIVQLQELRVPVRVALEPLVPTLTDTRTNLVPLLEALAAVGIREITAGYMFVRPGIRDQLIDALAPYGWQDQILDAFAGGPVLSSAAIAAAQYLPKKFRQHGYATLMALASEVGITVRISPLTNPDFIPAGRAPRTNGLEQRRLPCF